MIAREYQVYIGKTYNSMRAVGIINLHFADNQYIIAKELAMTEAAI